MAGERLTAASEKRRPGPRPQVGEWVLCGRTGITLPSDWTLDLVLWTGKGEVVVERFKAAGCGSWVEVVPQATIIRAGDYGDLRQFRDRCAREVGDLCRAVRNAETALGDARKAVWTQLDEIAGRRALEKAGDDPKTEDRHV